MLCASCNLLLKVTHTVHTYAFFSTIMGQSWVLSVPENRIMCLASFLGWNAAWCLSASSEVSPHQQQSRWGPSPQAKPSHQPHVSHSPPCLASCSDHSHNKRRNIGKTAGCGAWGWGKNCKTLHQNFKKKKKDWVCPKSWKVPERKSKKYIQVLVSCQKFVIPSVATFVIFPNYWSPLFCWLEPSSYIIGLCLLWVWIQPWWMEVLWYSPIRRQAFLWPCPLMHY